jgi:hypothetical protein
MKGAKEKIHQCRVTKKQEQMRQGKADHGGVFKKMWEI